MHAVAASEALLAHYAGPSETSQCSHTGCAVRSRDEPLYRCTECFRSFALCKTHIVDGHNNLPFHAVQRWDSEKGCWRRCSLGSLGLELHLGHNGSPCIYSHRGRATVVVHENGIHSIKIRYCGCLDNKDDEPTQLLRVRLWPASWGRPETAFTFGVLKTFRLLTVLANTNAYDCFRYLAELTDDVLPDECPVSGGKPAIYLIEC